MYIKRLEIVGFKSFPERTLVPLSQGLSAVVGPNGCGKSNIIDAVRWVMGEQSPRTLRGRNMDDVLFNGSQGRPASALAEVTLTLARDPDSGLAAAESSVTRRLYRSGDSEYLLNRTPCRLKDVIRFFTDQGVGTRAYGIIEQGRVGWLVDARPEERRGLIDEAAGITRYKQQKKEAERKIESAESNLDHVAVIKAETKKQLDQITRAAAKAARYKDLKEKLRDLDLSLAARALGAARARRQDLTRHLEENRRLLTSLLAESETRDLELEEIKRAAARAEQSLAERTAAWHQLSAARDSLAQEARYTRENLTRTAERRAQALEELARVSSERRRKLEEQALLEAELEDLEQAEQRSREAADLWAEEWRARKSAHETLNRQYDETERRRAGLEKELSAGRSSRAASESLLDHQGRRLETLSEELEAGRQNSGRLAEVSAETGRQKDRLAMELAAAQEESDLRNEDLKAAESRLKALENLRNLAEAKLASLSARLETLKSVRDDFGWYPQGVKALMASPELTAAGLLGPVAEFLKIPDGYEDAAEAVLGERLAWLLVKDRAAALAALDFLRREGLGRCGFVCLDEMGQAAEDLSLALLGDYQLTEDLSPGADRAAVLMSKKGQYLGRGLAASAAAADSGRDEAGLLARLKDLEEAGRLAEKARSDFAALKSQAAEASGALEESREMARSAEAARQKLGAALLEADKNLALAAAEAAQARLRHEALSREAERLEGEIEARNASLAEGRARSRQAEEAAARAAREAETLKETLAGQREALEEDRAEGEALRLAAAAAGEKLTRVRQQLAMAEEWLREVENSLAARESESRTLAEEMENLKAGLESLQTREAAFPEKIKAAEEGLAGDRRRQEDERRRQEAGEKALRDLRRRREELNALLAGQETELLAARFSIEKIEEDLARDWQVIMPDPEAPEKGLAAPEAEPDPEEEPDEEPDEESADSAPLWETLDPRDYAARPLPEGAAARREALKGKIGSLGEVSLEAIEREAGLRAEYERYQSQFDDLSRAVADLKNSINRINHTCKIRFAETFRAVDEKFREIFPILFDGGQGWLSLTDEPDPLESGVEIHVHPPGKKLLVMSLLSGGEKALTALALIFALYLIKPSPFCLLDETDAPLDEANIDRFNRLLKQLSRASQIIMVTHNKRTMQISQTLYGVTMETPGVSRLVSVNLAQAEAMTADV
ncbi:MAG: chromosome segregation protein SMC [Candidatus Adiutrix sp.]|jgi:chromosome segregation protein|nr:chromosome segregation protein SMC [Candidatus Adiutrix sp.]